MADQCEKDLGRLHDLCVLAQNSESCELPLAMGLNMQMAEKMMKRRQRLAFGSLEGEADPKSMPSATSGQPISAAAPVDDPQDLQRLIYLPGLLLEEALWFDIHTPRIQIHSPRGLEHCVSSSVLGLR